MSLTYDPRPSEVRADPYPVLRRLQAEDPVHWSPVLGGWVVTRYTDVKTVLSHPGLSADRITPFLAHRSRQERGDAEALGRQVGLWAVFTDPPTHTRLRALLNRAFTSRVMERLRPRIGELVRELLDRARDQGEMDVIRDFAGPLPVAVIAELMGVPREDRAQLKAWSDALASFVGSALGTPEKYARAGLGLDGLSDYFRRLTARRRVEPREDIVSGLIAARDQGGALGEDELIATCVMLLFAGHETTTNLIGNAVLALLRHPDAARGWRGDAALTSSAVEELLRYDGPTQAMARIAREDMELGGRRIGRGDRVFAMVNAANRDPRQFDAPNRLDLRRGDNRHLAFGHGIHYCVGAPLARLEAQIALPGLLAGLPDLELLTDAPEWLDSLVFRGVTALPVAFR